jgi:hypothetical protein
MMAIISRCNPFIALSLLNVLIILAVKCRWLSIFAQTDIDNLLEEKSIVNFEMEEALLQIKELQKASLNRQKYILKKIDSLSESSSKLFTTLTELKAEKAIAASKHIENSNILLNLEHIKAKQRLLTNTFKKILTYQAIQEKSEKDLILASRTSTSNNYEEVEILKKKLYQLETKIQDLESSLISALDYVNQSTKSSEPDYDSINDVDVCAINFNDSTVDITLSNKLHENNYLHFTEDFAQVNAGAKVMENLTSQTFMPLSKSPNVQSMESLVWYMHSIFSSDQLVSSPVDALTVSTNIGNCWAMQVLKRLLQLSVSSL